jgi:hypothetical protein
MESTTVQVKAERKPMSDEEKAAFVARMKEARERAAARRAAGSPEDSVPRSRSSSPEAWSVDQILKEEEALATMESSVEAMYASIHSLQREQDAITGSLLTMSELFRELIKMEARLMPLVDVRGIRLQQEATDLQMKVLRAQTLDLMDKEGKEAAEAVKLSKAITEKRAELQRMRGLTLPKVKADGTLDMRYKTSRLIRRADGGLDMRFKMSQNAVKMGIVVPEVPAPAPSAPEVAPVAVGE